MVDAESVVVRGWATPWRLVVLMSVGSRHALGIGWVGSWVVELLESMVEVGLAGYILYHLHNGLNRDF
jgi:hypothetical protein